MKLVQGILKSLKYIGILLIVLYLFLVVKFYISPIESGIKERSVITRIEEAFAEALFMIVMPPFMLIMSIYKKSK